MDVQAVGKYIRISPQKVRKLAGQIKGKAVGEALNILSFMPQKSARIVRKIINSAAANADHNNKLDIDDLIISNLMVDQGPTLKRFKARARGRGSRILKRTSHITVILAEK